MRKLIVLVFVALGLLCLPAAPALASAKTFTVHPSGGNDTAIIRAAFKAAAKAGPGSIVQLTAGRFHTNTIFVKGFKGYFRGAGKGRTVIDTLQGLGSGQPVVIVMPAVEPFPFLFGFSRGNVRVSAMTCDITAPSPAAPWVDDGNTTTALDTVFLVTGNASSTFHCVDFTANAGDENGFNVAASITVQGPTQFNSAGEPVVLGPTGGVDTVSRCSFAGAEGVFAAGLRAARLTVGGSPRSQNNFDMVGYGCVFFDNSNSQIRVCHNRMQSSQGENVWLWQGWVAGFGGALPALPAPRYVITDNSILGSGVAGGVWLEDDASYFFGAASRLDAVIADNTIALDNGGADGGIDGFTAQGICVSHNHISGDGLAGIDLGTPYFFGIAGANSGWQIIGNDVSGVNAIGGAPIWLGPGADHCLVVGGKAPTKVLDQGTDNTLINVTQLPLPAASSASPMGQTKRMLMRGVLP